MPRMLIPFIALLVSISQSASVMPFRTGDVARQLTEQDVKAIELVLPSDSKPWLLNGDPGQIGNAQFIDAYLSPTAATPSLRRGTVITVMRRISPPTAWTARPAEAYAQVSIAGKKFDEIQGDQDVNRPFRVIGSINDDQLIAIIDVLRSSQTSGERGMNAIRMWPILRIGLQPDGSVQVLTRGAVMQGQSITLHYGGQKWSVIAVGNRVA
jgi:hypothetical protein